MESFGARPGNAPEGRKIDEAEIKRAFATNRFIGLPSPVAVLQLVVPPEMRMTVRVPGDGDQPLENGSITFESRYFRLMIETDFLSSGMFIGRYGFILGVDPNDRRFSSASYSIRVMGKAKVPFQLHPDIPRYQAWGQQIGEGLRLEFDEAQRWKTAMENAVFHHMLMPSSRERPKRGQ